MYFKCSCVLGKLEKPQRHTEWETLSFGELKWQLIKLYVITIKDITDNLMNKALKSPHKWSYFKSTVRTIVFTYKKSPLITWRFPNSN